MDRKVKAYKRKFDRALRHIKVLLMIQKRSLTRQQWVNFVYETKAAILEDPEECFCFELPNKKIFTAAIEEVFKGFFMDQKIRDAQQSRVIK